MQENDFDYLSIQQQDQTVLSNLTAMGERLKELKAKQLAAEQVAAQAKNEFEHYANVVIPQEMAACGVQSLSLKNGGTLTLKHNYYCQPNKNPEDRATIAAWLRAHNGGHLIQHDATVSAEDFDKLSQSGIPFVENTVVNTTRLKAFLKAGVAPGSGTQQFSISDIPECMHFQQVTTVDISL